MRRPGQAHLPSAAFQVDVIKKAYLQEEECENAEVSPREVGHNIYILALQVLTLQSAATAGSPPGWAPRAVLGSHSPICAFFSVFIYISSSRAGKCAFCLPQKPSTLAQWPSPPVCTPCPTLVCRGCSVLC